ncbi:MAG TPA: NAD(P)/FAD-dependent oxidoreductase [Terriglobia bacterium]|nr:NAD(P)/FAD-dependent oxidoreductase [Terriglobia bacterium]
MAKSHDLIVVGGGLAGSTLAKCLAERGASVLVLEREVEFKDRVRGEFVIPWGVAEMRALHLDSLLRRKVGHDVPWVDIHSDSNLLAHRPMVDTTPHRAPCMSFYHPQMQELLMDAAASAGARIRRGAAVREVRTGSTPNVVVEENGRTEEIQARLVVGADGRSSCVRTTAGFEMLRDPENMMVAGLLMENMPAPEDTGQIVMSTKLGQIAALFPQGGGLARNYFCFHTGTEARLQGAADVPRFVDGCKKVGVNPSFFEGAKPAGPLATFSGAETWVPHPYRNGVALMGDAAAASDPSWGQGLSQTLRDARVLRDHLLATEDWDAAGHAYAAEHDRYAQVTHMATLWSNELFVGLGPEAEARRARALPLIAQDPTRQPDAIFSGPDMPMDESVRKRFFGED